MINGKQYQLVMAPAAHRHFKKLAPPLQEKVKTEAKRLAQEPYSSEELKGPLKGLYSYKFSFKGTTYRISQNPELTCITQKACLMMFPNQRTALDSVLVRESVSW
ncbi:type II toxin-antitoxin system RelE/ParE family toxin [Candidatus Bipolaricaulota bacterium]|nr:type II toxin-antitoxin system RelE/ParE family toxin [Candidatus Bipolaricaulota bacterium]